MQASTRRPASCRPPSARRTRTTLSTRRALAGRSGSRATLSQRGGRDPSGLSAHPRHDGSGDTFAVMDVRSGGADGWQLRVELASKLLLLLLSLDTAPCRHGVVSG